MHSSENKAVAFIVLMIVPFISLFYVLRNLNTKTKLLFMTLFGIVYGFTMSTLEGTDSYTHVQSMQAYYNLGFTDFIDQLVDIITFNSQAESQSDLYIHFLFGIAGSIFESPPLLFAIVGGIYGYFYGSGLLKVIKLPKGKRITLLMILITGILVILRGFEQMQTIRSWTGMWVVFNGVLGYYQTKNRKYILLIALGPFFHLMYTFIAVPALLIVVFKSLIPRNLIIGAYLISFFWSVNTSSVVDLASGNSVSESRLNSYYRVGENGEAVDPIAVRRETSNAVWYAKFGKTDAVYYGSIYFVFFLILAGYYKKANMTEVEFGVLSIGIATATLANFLSFSYALYSRTMANASVYIITVMVLLILRGSFLHIREPLWKKIGVWIGVLIFIPKILFFASDFLLRTSMLLIAFPFLKFFGDEYNLSIRDFVDFLL